MNHIEYDDDSDAPSIENNVSLDLDEDNNDIAINENTVVIQDNEEDEEDAVLNDSSAWRIVSPLDYANKIRIDVAEVNLSMMDSLKKQANHVIQSCSKISKLLGYGSIASSDEVRLANCFLPTEMLLKLLSIINSNLEAMAIDPLASMRELELLLRFMFSLGVYQKSSAQALATPEWFPGVAKVVREIKQATYAEKVERMRLLMQALDPMPTKVEEDWKGIFQENSAWSEIEETLSKHCSSLAWNPGFNLCVDDDKVSASILYHMNWCELILIILLYLQLRNRSNLVSLDYGFSRNKTPKSFGPVLNITALLGTGIFVSATMSCQGETVKDVNNRMFCRLCKTNNKSKIAFGGSVIASDRAYNGDVYQEQIEALGGATLNTVKRSATLPFVFGKVGFTKPTSIMEIPEFGTKTVFYAQKKIGRRFQHLTAFRSGTGRVTFLSSTESGKEAFMWTLIPKNVSTWHLSPPSEFLLETLLPENDITTLTVTQRDATWFAMRIFRFTSTTAVTTLRRLSGNVSKYSWFNNMRSTLRLLQEDIGLSVSNMAETDSVDPKIKHQVALALPADQLAEKSKSELRIMLQDFQVKGRTALLSTGTDKIHAANAILQAATDYLPPVDIPEDAQFLRHAFLKPLDKGSKVQKALEIGKHNEKNVLRNLKTFMSESNVVLLNDLPKEFGLTCRKDKPYLATSIDGMVFCASLSYDDGQSWSEPNQTIGIEIKTLTDPTSVEEMRNIFKNKRDDFTTNYHSSFMCQFGDNEFKAVVANTGYRTQVLHHCTVLQIDKLLYVIASDSKIIGCILIHVPLLQRIPYESFFTAYVQKYLLFLYPRSLQPSTNILQSDTSPTTPSEQPTGAARNPTPAGTSLQRNSPIPERLAQICSSYNLNQGKKYAIEGHSILVSYLIWRKLNEYQEKSKKPLPECTHFLPRIVNEWNMSKGMIDILSRYLSHVKFPVSPTASIGQVLIIRAVFLCAVNGFLVKRLIDNKTKLEKCNSYKSFKKVMANSQTLHDYFLHLGENYRIPPKSQMGVDALDNRTKFSPMAKSNHGFREYKEEDRATEKDQDVVYQWLKDSLEKEGRSITRAKYFHKTPEAKLVRLDRTIMHQSVSNCDLEGVPNKLSRRCVLCSRKTVFVCVGCRVTLCLKQCPQNNHKSCAEAWHNYDSDLLLLKKEREAWRKGEGHENEEQNDEEEEEKSDDEDVDEENVSLSSDATSDSDSDTDEDDNHSEQNKRNLTRNNLDNLFRNNNTEGNKTPSLPLRRQRTTNSAATGSSRNTRQRKLTNSDVGKSSNAARSSTGSRGRSNKWNKST